MGANQNAKQIVKSFVLNPLSRRKMIWSSAATLAGSAVLARGQDAPAADDAASSNADGWGVPRNSVDADGKPYFDSHWDRPGEPGRDYTPVVTPNGWTLPFRVLGGVKVFHLVAE